MATVSTSVASPSQMAGQMPAGPVATPVPAVSVATVPTPTPQPQQPTVTTQVGAYLVITKSPLIVDAVNIERSSFKYLLIDYRNDHLIYFVSSINCRVAFSIF